MMTRITAFLFTLLSVFSLVTAQTQRKVTITDGRKYMVAFPQVWASPTETPLPQPMVLYISANQDTKVRVRTPAVNNQQAGIDRVYQVKKNVVSKIPVTVGYMNTESESINGYGIEVTGETPITVYTYQAWNGNGELARQLPVSAWGKNYYTMNFYLDRYGAGGNYKYRPSQSLIIANYDNTIVSYTPTVRTEGGGSMNETVAGSTSTVTLNKGETFLIKSKVIESELKEFTSDMSGTRITANKPFGLVSGHTKVGIMRYPDVLPPTGMFAAEAHFVRNNVHDAMLPLEMAGREFVVVPAKYTPTRVTGQASVEFGIDDDRGDVIRFVATEDATTIGYKRGDGTVANIRRLNRGETHLVTSLEYATMYVADKPILVGHYGKSYAKIIPPFATKGGNSTQGHPTVESGMPMLQYVPPIDRWTQYGVFHAPEAMDNFFNIVFKTEDIGAIKIDGAALMSRFGGSVRPLGGTPYSYIQTSISSGDHVVSTDTNSSARWVAWTYGSLDGLQQGRAYGTPISMNLAYDCDDSLKLSIDTVCGDYTGYIDIYSNSQNCVGLFDVYLKESVNFTLSYDEDVNPSPTEMHVPFKVEVLDKTQRAYAVLVVLTRAGTEHTQILEYIPNAISVSPSSIDFGIQSKGDTVCRTFTVTNVGTKDFYIANVRAKRNPGLIKVTPGAALIGIFQSVTFDVCVETNFSGKITDTLIFSYASYVKEDFCYEATPVEIKIAVDDPDFYASDQNWGVIGKNQTLTKTVTLTNLGNADVEVYDYSPKLTGPNFSNLQVQLPLIIKKGDRINVNVDYTPNGEVGVTHSQRILWSTNATKTKLHSDLIGQGADASLEITNADWTERVIDQWQLNLGITRYLDTIRVANVGLRTAIVNSINLVGQDAASFTIVDATAVPNSFTGGAKDIPIVVSFVPTENPANRVAERTYHASVEIKYTVDGVESVVNGELFGTALQPRLSATGWDFGIVQVGTNNSSDVFILNVDSILTNQLTNDLDGTMDMELFELTIPNGNPFVWARNGGKTIQYSPGVTVRPGDFNKWSEGVIFSPTTVGSWSVPYTISYNGHIVTTPLLVGASEQTTEVRTTDAYFINWYNHTVRGTFTVTSTAPGVLEVSEPVSGDNLEFTILGWSSNTTPFNTNYKFIPVVAGEIVNVHVEFRPSAVTQAGLTGGQNLQARLPFRTTSFTTDVEVREITTGIKATATLRGDGQYLESTVYAPDYTNVQLGATVDVFVYLKALPQPTDSGLVSQFRTRLSYDPTLITPLAVITDGTQTAGWRQVQYTILNGNMIELDLKNDGVGTLIQSDEPIYGVRFQTLLAGTTVSPLGVQLYWVDLEQTGTEDRQYMVYNYEPGSIQITAPCAGLLRVINLGNTNYFIKVSDNLVSDNLDIQYGVGITANVELYLVGVTGEVITILSGSQASGTYNLSANISNLASGVYYLMYRSGDYNSLPVKFIKR